MDDAHKAGNIAFGAIGDVRPGDAASEQLWAPDHDPLTRKTEPDKQGMLRTRHVGYQQSGVEYYRNTHSLASTSPSSYRHLLSPPPATHLFHHSSRQFPPFDMNSQLQSTLNTSRPLRQEHNSHFQQQYHQQQQQTHQLEHNSQQQQQTQQIEQNSQQRHHSGQNDQYQTTVHSQTPSQSHMNHSFPLPIHSHDTTATLRKGAAELMPWYHPAAQQSQSRDVQDDQQSAGLLAQGGFPPAQLFDMGLTSSTLEPHPPVQSLLNSSSQSQKRATYPKRRVSRPNVIAQQAPTGNQNAAVRLASTPAIRKKSSVIAQKPIAQKNRTNPNGNLSSTTDAPIRRRASASRVQKQRIPQPARITRSTSGNNNPKSNITAEPVSRKSTGTNVTTGGVTSQTESAQAVVGMQKIYTKNAQGLDVNGANQAPRKRRHIETIASRPVNSAVGRIACEYCGQMFDMKRTRDIHVRSYHERSFPCEKCPSLFKTKSDANRHMRIVHDRVRPFSCTECSSTFAEKSKLMRHVVTVHKKLRPHVCSVCQAQFGEKGNLVQHENARHGHRSS